ncbi:MAG: hypothetical protein AAF514_21880 [Verrucomicrobiota bacterium]
MADLSEVSESQCLECCKHFEPTETELNPFFASLLFGVSRTIEEKGGVPGCSVERAKDLREFATKNLATINLLGGNKRPGRPITYEGHCFYLGNPTGEQRPCVTCQGNVRQKVFACRHEAHADTIIANCRECLDYDPALPLSSDAGGKAFSWVVCVRSAPRKQATLSASLESLARAGWPDPFLFVEPGTDVPDGFPTERLTVRTRTLGNFPNFFVALAELVMLFPEADAYMMCEDDVSYCRGLRPYLEETLWPSNRLGVVSLHTPQHQDRGDVAGFYPANPGWGAWGAQAFVFPNAAARAYLRNPQILNHRRRGPGEGKCNADSVVGQWCEDTGLDYYLHTPSLTQHIGETSTLWGEKATLEGRRHAATFVGEDRDIRDLMSPRSKSPKTGV